MRTIDEFVAAYTEVKYWWHALDEPILALCSRHPGHTDAKIVFGKVALINRAYRANVQMGVSNAEWTLAEALVAVHVDESMSTLASLDRLDAEALPIVLDAHERLVAIAKDATRRVTESFCSKYLSFHFPRLAPMFDSRAEATAKRLPLSRQTWSRTRNPRYRAHCGRVLELIDALRSAGIADPDLRTLDFVLYNTAGVEGMA